MVKNAVIDQMRLDGGTFCLDFVNTIPDRVDGSNRDHLGNFNDLIYWARKAKVIDNAGFSALEKSGGTNERKAKDFFTEAVNLRTLIYAIFQPVSQGHKVKPADLDAFNKLGSRYFSFLGISAQKDGFAEQWNFETGNFHAVTAPIFKSAYELLLSDKLGRVKECPNCGWLFLDTTKNGRRRWCSMQDCGSNVKALEYYYRKKKER
jgi:predicted RNA-binding Zn ribbon-like protein